jgi:hypothetical protein
MKKTIYIVLILFFAASCKKKTAVVIQAQDYITGEGSAYAGQEYAVSESWTPFQETKSKIVATGFLDENGKASFNLKMNRNRRYVMGVSEPDNICYGGLVQHYLEHEKNNLVDFKYAECGYLDIKSNNVNCEDTNDEFRYKYFVSSNPDIYIYKGFLYNGVWAQGVYIGGCQDYSGIYIYNQRPVGNYTVEWEVKRTSGTTTGTEYFSILENDTITYVIEY